jgi:RNA-dependent RNA polymerase
MFLNRPLIKVLEDLPGINTTEFEELQHEAVQEAQAINQSLGHASKVLKLHGIGASFVVPSTLSNIRQFLGCEIDDRQNPFLDRFIFNCLDLSIAHILRELKFKARIPVNDGSITLMGVADFWGVLRENEIYAPVKAKFSNHVKPIVGRVCVTRP